MNGRNGISKIEKTILDEVVLFPFRRPILNF